MGAKDNETYEVVDVTGMFLTSSYDLALIVILKLLQDFLITANLGECPCTFFDYIFLFYTFMIYEMTY